MGVMIDWPAATMIGGAIVQAGALGYTAYRHFSTPWLVQGTGSRRSPRGHGRRFASWRNSPRWP